MKAFSGLFRKFTVHISFRNLILGGRPITKDILESWLKEREAKIASGEDLRSVGRSELKEIKSSDIKASSWNTFETDKDGVYVEERNIKGMLREAGMMTQIGRRSGFADTVRNGVFAKPEKIHLKRDDSILTKPDGFIDRIVLIKGRSKNRTALKRIDFIKQPQIDFELWVAAIALSGEDVQTLFSLGQELGLGASRTQGFGKFDANIKPLPEMQAEPQS